MSKNVGLAILVSLADLKAATAMEIARHTGKDYTAVRFNAVTLWKMRLIRPNGFKRTARSGMAARVWVIHERVRT